MSRKGPGGVQFVPTTCAARRVMSETRRNIEATYNSAVRRSPEADRFIRSLGEYISDEWLTLQLVTRHDIAALAAHNKGGFGRASFAELSWVMGNNGPTTRGDWLFGVETTGEVVVINDLLGRICGVGMGLADFGTSREGRDARFADERTTLLDRVEDRTGLVFPEECREYPLDPALTLVEFPGGTIEGDYALEVVADLSIPITKATPSRVDLFEVTARDPIDIEVPIL